MNTNYLIPANSKKSLLIFSMFNWFDLILFGIGLTVTIILLMVLSPASVWLAILDLAPALITGFLVMPIPNYHNTLTLIKDLYTFFTTRQKFIWKGWCVADEFKDTKQVHK